MATESDSPNTGALATIGAVGALAMVGICFAVTALVRHEVGVEEEQKGTTANTRPYRDLSTTHRQELTAPAAWVDKNKQTVSIPIDRAMELVLADIKQDPLRATATPSGQPAGSAAPAGPSAGDAPGATSAAPPAGAAPQAPGAAPQAPGAAPQAPGAAPQSPGTPAGAGTSAQKPKAPSAAPGQNGAAAGGQPKKPAPPAAAPAAPSKPNAP